MSQANGQQSIMELYGWLSTTVIISNNKKNNHHLTTVSANIFQIIRLAKILHIYGLWLLGSKDSKETASLCQIH